MFNLKKILKLSVVICMIAASSYAAAGSLAFKKGLSSNKSADCNSGTDFCVHIMADNSIPSNPPFYVSAYFSYIVDGTTYSEPYVNSINQYTYISMSAPISEIKRVNATEVSIGVSQAGGQSLTNCVVKETGSQIVAGIHTLMISKASGKVTCSVQ